MSRALSLARPALNALLTPTPRVRVSVSANYFFLQDFTERDQDTVRRAIARCQKRRWIEHNLETGYVLP